MALPTKVAWRRPLKPWGARDLLTHDVIFDREAAWNTQVSLRPWDLCCLGEAIILIVRCPHIDCKCKIYVHAGKRSIFRSLHPRKVPRDTCAYCWVAVSINRVPQVVRKLCSGFHLCMCISQGVIQGIAVPHTSCTWPYCSCSLPALMFLSSDLMILVHHCMPLRCWIYELLLRPWRFASNLITR